MKKRVKIVSLPKAQMGTETRGKLTNNAFQFPVTFKQGMEPNFTVGKSLGPVNRDQANIEAEKGETILTPMGDDAWTKTLPKTYVIGGKKHYKGGTPLNVPAGSFIFSDHLKEKNLKMQQMLGKAPKKSGYTYAELSKPYMLNEDIKTLIDPDSDRITRTTAQMNIQNKVEKLGLISLLQEAQKGFTDDEGNVDMPSVGMPYIEKTQLDVSGAVDPFMAALRDPQNQMADQMQMQELPMMPMGKRGGLVKMKKGGKVGLKKYAPGGGVPNFLREGERVVLNPTTNEMVIVNAQGNIVGKLNKQGSDTTRITRDKIPSNAIIIDRKAYKTDEDFQKARAEIYANAGGKPVVIQNGSNYTVLGQRPVMNDYAGEDLNTLFAGQKNIANNYAYLQNKFNDPKVKAELSRRAIAALNDPNRRGKSMTAAEVKELQKKLEDPEYAYQMFMDMQKRNLATLAHQQSGNLGRTIAEHQDAANPNEVSNKDFYDSWTKVGVNTPTEAEAKMQQALYIGYADLITDKNAGKITDPELASAIKDFKISQVGAKDPADLTGVGGGPGKISIIDGDYTNTTTGEIAATEIPNEFVENPLAPGDDYVKAPKSPQYKPGMVPKGWTAPDIMNYWGAVNEIYADQPQQPYQAFPTVFTPEVAIMSPEDMQRQIRGTANAKLDMLNTYANRKQAANIASAFTDADQIAAQTANVHNTNIGIINQHENNKAGIYNRAAENYANLTTSLADKWAQLKDNMQARKSAAKSEARKAFGIGENNEGAFQAMNLQSPNYLWDPLTQDYMGFVPGSDIDPTISNKKTSADLFAEYRNRFPGVSDNAIASLVKSDMGIKDSNIPDFLDYYNG